MIQKIDPKKFKVHSAYYTSGGPYEDAGYALFIQTEANDHLSIVKIFIVDDGYNDLGLIKDWIVE